MATQAENELPVVDEIEHVRGVTEAGDSVRTSLPARVREVVLTGLSTASASAIAATDTILVALGKLQASISEIADGYAAKGSSNTFTANQTIQGTAPALVFVETDQSTDEKRWDYAAVSGQLRFRAINDENGGHVNWLTVNRTETNIDAIRLNGDIVDLGASGVAQDYGGTDRRVGWVPEVIEVTSSRNIAESDMNHILHADTSGGAFTLTIPSGLSGKRLQIITTGSNGITIDDGSGVTLLWLQGGSGSFSTRTIADASEITLIRRGTDSWTIFGNGIS